MVNRNSWSAFLLVGLLASMPVTTAVAQTAEPTNSQTEQTEIEAQFTQTLLGQWDVTFPSINGSEEVTQTFLLAPEGQFFDLSPTDGTIIQFPWWIDYHEQTPVLIVNTGNVLLAGVLTGPDTMIMRLVPLDSTENAEQIRSINLNARKLSTDVELPANRTVISGAEHFQAQARLARQSQAKITVATINRAQQAYILEYQEFASNDEFPTPLLGDGLSIDSEHYTYEVRRSETGNVAYAIASPIADGFNSFIGMVIQPEEGTLAQQIVCESTEPTRQIPTIIPPDTSGNLTCPAGYE